MRSGLASAYLALCAAVLFWGLSFPATKLALEGLSPFVLLLIRFAVAAALLWPVVLRGVRPRLPLGLHLRVLGVSVLFPGCYFACETLGLTLTTATNAALIDATIPLVVLGLSALLLRERQNPARVGAVLASLTGAGLVVGGGASPANAGDALMLGAVVSAALYMLAGASLTRRVPPLTFTALQMLYGTLFFLPLGAPRLEELALAPAPSLLAALALALFATVGGFAAYNHALSRLSASTAAVFINAVPVVAGIGAHLTLGERLGPFQLLGALLVLAGAHLAATRREAPQAKRQPA